MLQIYLRTCNSIQDMYIEAKMILDLRGGYFSKEPFYMNQFHK